MSFIDLTKGEIDPRLMVDVASPTSDVAEDIGRYCMSLSEALGLPDEEMAIKEQILKRSYSLGATAVEGPDLSNSDNKASRRAA